jgi:hypothetical protein
MRRKKEYIFPRLNDMVWGYQSFYKSAVDDKEFRKKWKLEKLYRGLKQGNCLYCKERFGKSTGVLHHRLMPFKEEEVYKKRIEIVLKIVNGEISHAEGAEIYITMMDELMRYYKSLKDVDYICKKCHDSVHNFRGINGQKKLF